MILPSDHPAIPAYGTLPLPDEWNWYQNFRYYWLRYVEHEMKRLLTTGSDAFINANWPLMSKEYKAAVWALMSPEERERIRNVRNNR